MSRRRQKKFRKKQAQAQAVVQPQVPADGSSLIAAAEKRVESQLTPNTHESYLKIVVAGMKAGLADGPNSILASLKKSQDPISDCAKGAVAIVLILKHQAKGIMPVKAMIPAGMTLMLKALNTVDKTGLAKVGSDELARATNIFMSTFLHKFGVTPEMVQHATVKVHKMIQDPIAVEQMKRASGVVRHPEAAEPTPPSKVI